VLQSHLGGGGHGYTGNVPLYH